MKVCGEVAPEYEHGGVCERTHAHAGTRFVDGQAQTDSRGNRSITDRGGGLSVRRPPESISTRLELSPAFKHASGPVHMFKYPPARLPPLQLFSSDVVDSPKCFVLGTAVIIVTKHFSVKRCGWVDRYLRCGLCYGVCVCVCS